MSFGSTKGAIVDSRSSSSTPAPAAINSLRILLVDDNQINLSVLSTLLKRRFGHVLACSPVALDSGLKALQLLRTEVFDLVFMDIEMPYLDGVECARRIRCGEDGILEANRDAHIVAVTTNIGDEPEDLYRSVGMDGMIGKPVRFDQFQQYLSPLALQAKAAQSTMIPVVIGDRDVMPPLPPVGRQTRIFFKPSLGLGASVPQADESHGWEGSEDSFASMLTAQTKASLRDRRAMFLARTGTVSEPRRCSFNDRQAKLARQSVREIASSNERNEVTFQALIDKEALGLEPMSGRASPFVRPPVYHRFSSPAYLLDASPVAKLKTDPAARSTPNLVRSSKGLSRPSIRPLIGALSKSHGRDSATSPSSSENSSRHGSLLLSLSTLRRSSGGGDDTSSSAITMPPSSPKDAFGAASEFDGAVFSPCEDDLHSVYFQMPTNFDLVQVDGCYRKTCVAAISPPPTDADLAVPAIAAPKSSSRTSKRTPCLP